MSQAGTYGDGGSPVLPDVETLTGDSGGAVGPTAGNIDIFGVDSGVNNVEGITTVGTPGSSLLEVTLTNRVTGTLTTTDASLQTLLTFPLGGTAGTYLFDYRIVGYNTTDSISTTIQSFNAVRTTGAAASQLSAVPSILLEEGAMEDVIITATVTGNNAIIRVNGLAGKTINWLVLATYTFVS